MRLQYLSVYDHITNKRIAFLGKAYKISYAKRDKAVWTASFTLPLSDPKNRHCKTFNFVEIYDGDDYIGLFRIMPKKTRKDASTREIVYECEHVIATLMDDFLFGWHEIGNLGVYTTEVLRYVIDRQTEHRWQLGECDFSHQFLYGWEHENLLTALFSVATPFLEDYRWEYDTQNTPWTVSLKRVPVKAEAEIRYGKNMLGISKEEDPSTLCTRLYPMGYGEGVNQLTIESVEPRGRKYIDADTQSEFGIISKPWIDQRYQHARSLYDAALEMLEHLKTPAISYTVSSLHSPELRRRDVGDLIRVADDELGIDIYTRILSISKPDVTGDPDNVNFEIANRAASIASTIADISDRQRINAAYSQGAVTLFTTHFYDNCAPTAPAELRFYVPNNVVHINQILLNGRAAAFRGYSKATKGGGAQSDTVGSGGGSYGSTESGGGSTRTSTAVALTPQNTEAGDSGGIGAANHNHGIPDGSRVPLVDWNGNIIGTSSFVASGSHTHREHDHDIVIPAHRHSVEITPHTHRFSVPDHTHEIEYGIYSGSSARALTLIVDGNTVPLQFGAYVNDLDLVDYLSKDNSGNITRGWHTIQVRPDVLSRVEFDLVVQLFANSRGGGQF